MSAAAHGINSITLLLHFYALCHASVINPEGREPQHPRRRCLSFCDKSCHFTTGVCSRGGTAAATRLGSPSAAGHGRGKARRDRPGGALPSQDGQRHCPKGQSLRFRRKTRTYSVTTDSSPNCNACFQRKGADLIDDACSLADELTNARDARVCRLSPSAVFVAANFLA